MIYSARRYCGEIRRRLMTVHAGGMMPGVASVARNPLLAGCNWLVAYATWKLGAAWSGVDFYVVHN